jgi:hypothetical protein
MKEGVHPFESRIDQIHESAPIVGYSLPEDDLVKRENMKKTATLLIPIAGIALVSTTILPAANAVGEVPPIPSAKAKFYPGFYSSVPGPAGKPCVIKDPAFIALNIAATKQLGKSRSTTVEVKWKLPGKSWSKPSRASTTGHGTLRVKRQSFAYKEVRKAGKYKASVRLVVESYDAVIEDDVYTYGPWTKPLIVKVTKKMLKSTISRSLPTSSRSLLEPRASC